MEWKSCDLEAVGSAHGFAEGHVIHSKIKIAIHVDSCAPIIQPHGQCKGQSGHGHSLCIILYECSLLEPVGIEKATIVLENDEPKNRHQEQAGNSSNFFSNPKLHSHQTPVRTGIWKLLWWAILAVMALCGNIAGTVDFAQLAEQGIINFWQFLGM